MSKRYGSLKYASSRLAEMYHGDLLAHAHLDPAEGNVARERAAHVQDGARPPDDLLGRGQCAPFQILEPPALLVRKLRQRPEPVADRVPGGLVARGDEEQDERPEVGRRQRLAVELGVDERRRDVFLRVLEPALAEPKAVIAQLVTRLSQRLFRPAVLGIAPGQQAIG